MTALCLLDIMLSDDDVDGILERIKKKHINILVHLMKYYKNNDDDKLTDDYVYDTFQCFVNNKQHIYVNYGNMTKKEISRVRELIWNKMEKDRTARSEFDETNLFKRELFQLFKFTKKLTLFYIDEYQISLWSLLSLIKETSLEQIILEYGFKDYVLTSDLEKKYGDTGYDISKQGKNIIISKRK